jgi:formate hydrogenlyase transcriptional activator
VSACSEPESMEWASSARVLAACPCPAWIQRQDVHEPDLRHGEVLFANSALRERLGANSTECPWDALEGDALLDDSLADPAYIRCTLRVAGVSRELVLRPQRIAERAMVVVFVLDDPEARTRIERSLSDALREVEKLTRELESERRYLREEIDASVERGPVVGNTALIHALIDQVGSVARTDSTVLILGETGTGKELVARMIHQSSARAERTLVKVNCAALPATLVESELFGHERGAFTGAVTRRQGRFEVADRGTLFLDEVGELPLEMQAKLLRVIQEQEFERVGSSAPVRVNVRVIAATNRELSAEVAAGRFRADLYYRLAVFPLRIPPLRERKDDIPLLAEHFVARYSRQLRRRCDGLSADACGWLEKYGWPGNVRELESVIERALILMPGTVIDQALLQRVGVQASSLAPSPPGNVPANILPQPTTQHEPEALVTLEEMERAYIERVLRVCEGRIEGEDGAARILGLAPSTLRSRMNKLRVHRPSS